MAVESFDLMEMRRQSRGSSAPTAHVAANDASWDAGTAPLVRAQELDITGLTWESVKDGTIQSLVHGKPPPIPTKRTGTFKHKMWLGGAGGSTTPHECITLLSKVMGGLTSAAGLTDAVEASASARKITATAHGQVAGDGAMIGVQGDGRGGGKVVFADSVETDLFYVLHDLPVAPDAADAIAYGHTVFLDPSAVDYNDFLIIGAYPGASSADGPFQVNVLGCVGEVVLGGFDSAPFCEFTWNCIDWRIEPYATKAAFAPSQALDGDDPCGTSEIGQHVLQDHATYTRNTIQSGDIAINPNITWTKITDFNGPNSHGGYFRAPSEDGPMIEFSQYWADQPGKKDDFAGGSSLYTLIQIGSTAGDVVAIEMQKCHHAEIPTWGELERGIAIPHKLEGDDKKSTDHSSAAKEKDDSAIRIFFG